VVVADLHLLPEPGSRTQVPDWAIRVSVAIPYFLIGVGKFSSSPGSHWVTLFEQIHAGQWFRYFTGIVESSAALLVLIPRAAIFGLLLLACSMLCASLIVALLLHQPGEAGFPGLLFLVLAVICWKRGAHQRKI
jgi:putative oxidoreductase